MNLYEVHVFLADHKSKMANNLAITVVHVVFFWLHFAASFFHVVVVLSSDFENDGVRQIYMYNVYAMIIVIY
jgi:hypothetical protein